MDEAYKHTLTNASLTLNTSKEIIEIYQNRDFGGMKITPLNINARNKVLIHSLLYVERKKVIRGGLLEQRNNNLIFVYNAQTRRMHPDLRMNSGVFLWFRLALG